MSAEEHTVMSTTCSLPVTAEAMHIGSLIAAQGYFFPISDHVLSLKDDGTFYRFQVSRRVSQVIIKRQRRLKK